MHDGEVDTFTVSTSERLIDPGTVYELPVPLSDPSGGFLVYSWEEKSGEAVRFTVRTDGGRTLLDEVQVRSEGRLCVSESSRLSLCWDNAGAWLKTLNVRYSVKVVSDRGVQNTLRTRLLHAARHGLLSAVEECLDHGVPIEGTNEAGYTPLILACRANYPECTKPETGTKDSAIEIVKLIMQQPEITQAIQQKSKITLRQ